MKDLLQWDKVGDEIGDFYTEVFVTNRPRYKDPRNWSDLWIDFLNAFFDMNYTLAHLVGIGLPLWALWHYIGRPIYVWVTA